MSLKTKLACALRPQNKTAFVASLSPGSAVLDIGCGNRSAERIKLVQPALRYVGVDVGDYLQTETSFNAMDRYLCVESPGFADAILTIGEAFDAVISSHNIEHCEQPEQVVDAMCAALKPGGRLYFAFPSEASVRFPKRAGTLNFYDDPTHRTPPNYLGLLGQLKANGMQIDSASQRSRPFAYAAAGLMIEPWSALTSKVDDRGAIWALWGFESIIWATKQRHATA